MPFDDFEANLKVLRSLGNRLYITLPNHKALLVLHGCRECPNSAARKLAPLTWKFRWRKISSPCISGKLVLPPAQDVVSFRLWYETCIPVSNHVVTRLIPGMLCFMLPAG